MSELLSGKPVVEAMRENMKQRVEAFKQKGIEPTLIIIRVGERPDDVSYERGIMKNCDTVGIKPIQHTVSVDISQDDLLACIEKANNDKDIHGIMIFRPLPKHIDPEAVQNAINPEKDIDCITNANLAKVFEGTAKLYPCTPQAVVTLIKHYNIPLQGKNVVVAGRSLVVGKPLAMLLLNENATVTVCHSKTDNIEEYTKNCDVMIAAIGRAKTFNSKHFTKDSVVIDVGINWDDKENKIVGDVDYEDVKDLVKYITPSVGGIGLVTTNTLLNNTVNACENLSNK